MSHLTEDDLTLLYYSELPDADAQSARAHLQQCAACRIEQDKLRGVLAIVDSWSVPEPAAGFESKVWRRLQPALRASAPPRGGWLSSTLAWLHESASAVRPSALGFPPSAQRWALGGAIATVAVVAFLTGRYWQPDRPATVGTQVAQTAPDDALRERILLTALGDHFDRTQSMLVELASTDPAATVDISREQRRAHDLLAATRIYRRAAAEAGDRIVGDVLEALERVLVEVDVSPSQMSAYELQSLQKRIAEQELLFKLRVASASVRNREQSTRQPVARRTAGA
jgi:hypothetical protein